VKLKLGKPVTVQCGKCRLMYICWLAVTTLCRFRCSVICAVTECRCSRWLFVQFSRVQNWSVRPRVRSLDFTKWNMGTKCPGSWSSFVKSKYVRISVWRLTLLSPENRKYFKVSTKINFKSSFDFYCKRVFELHILT